MYLLDAGILIMVQHEKLMMFSLNMVDYSMSCLRWVLVGVGPRGFGTNGLGPGLDY